MTPLSFFGPGRKKVLARAPGRLDVMGGIADYSGSLVLEMPIAQGTKALAARRSDGLWRVYSREAGSSGLQALVEVPTRWLETEAKARSFFAKNAKTSWASYALGCVTLLLREKKMPAGGADLHLVSDVPLARGLSSSASVEVAAMTALGRLFKISFGPTELPVLCQRVENQVVGAPCGLMDQLTCYLGKKDRLLPILCQPDIVQTQVPVPRGIGFVGIDSGVRHWVGGSSYSAVRTAAFMGYSLIALKEGAAPKELRRVLRTGKASSLPYGGFLSNIPPAWFQSHYSPHLPEKMKGRDFLRLAGASIDRVTEVEPSKTYSVRSCARHPVFENSRVARFKEGLLTLTTLAKGRGEILAQMGGLMFQSHESYGACGLGEPVTDRIVAEARKAGPGSGVYGAKITGGGSGGTVCLLTEGRKGLETAGRIARKAVGPRAFLVHGSSDGARWS